MSFSKSGTVITQDVSTTDTDLTGLAAIAGVSRTWDGFVTVYTFTAGDTLVVNGTLTVDPEIERLHITANNGAITTGSASRFNIGLEKTTTVTDAAGNKVTTNFSRGVAITIDRAPTQFYGFGNNSIICNGDVVWTGATVEISGNIQFPSTSTNSLWTRDAVLISKTINKSDVDPQTGATAAANAGTYIGVSDGTFGVVPDGRGWISNFFNGNYRMDGFTILNGGEMLFNASPASGNNSLSSTPNGIFGYAAERANYAIFPNRIKTFSINNPSLSGNGNFLDVPIQSESATGEPTITQSSVDASAVGYTTSVFNSAGGSAMRIIGGEAGITAAGASFGRDGRSCGNVIIFRDINFNCRNGVSNAQLSNASFYLRDFQHTTNNRRRSGNGINHTANRIYTGLITAGVLSTDRPILVGEVIVPIVTGTNTTLFNRRNTTNSPSVTDPTTGFLYAMDVRSSTNTLGNDTFPVHIWQPSHNYLPLTIDLSDGSTGTLTIDALMTTDILFTGTDGVNVTSCTNINDVYNAVKNRKIVSDTQRTQPTTSTLWVSESSGYLDVGARALTISTGSATGGFTPTPTTFNISIGTNTSLVAGDVFTGLKSSTSIDLARIDLDTVRIESASITNFPTTLPGGFDVNSTFTTAPTTDITYAFDTNADVSNLTITHNGTATINIVGKISTDFKALNGTGTFAFPVQKTIVVTLPTLNTVRQIRFTYGGTVVTPTKTTTADSQIWTFDTLVTGDLKAGVYVDKFQYAQLTVANPGTAGLFALIPIADDAINFDVSLGTLAALIVANFTGSYNTVSTIYSATIDKDAIDSSLQVHTAIRRSEAQLLTRRLLESDAGIQWLLALADNVASSFNTYDTSGWIINDPTKIQIVYDKAETRDLQINHFPRSTTNVAAWDKIINVTTPNLSPGFPSEGPNVTPVTPGISDEIGDIVVSRTSTAFKKTSRLIPVNDSDFPT